MLCLVSLSGKKPAIILHLSYLFETCSKVLQLNISREKLCTNGSTAKADSRILSLKRTVKENILAGAFDSVEMMRWLRNHVSNSSDNLEKKKESKLMLGISWCTSFCFKCSYEGHEKYFLHFVTGTDLWWQHWMMALPCHHSVILMLLLKSITINWESHRSSTVSSVVLLQLLLQA